METTMRKPRDFDAELKSLEDKARDLRARKVQQLGAGLTLIGLSLRFRLQGGFSNMMLQQLRPCHCSPSGASAGPDG
jgi:hypothetical protein